MSDTDRIRAVRAVIRTYKCGWHAAGRIADLEVEVERLQQKISLCGCGHSGNEHNDGWCDAEGCPCTDFGAAREASAEGEPG